MSIEEDPRLRVARRAFALSWIFFTIFVAVNMVTALTLGNEPWLFGLPLWVAVSCILVPTAFVLLLIPLIEKLIPDISLDDDQEDKP